MTDLAPVTALDEATPRMVQIGALCFRENTGLALASVAAGAGQGWPAPFALAEPAPGRWVALGDHAAFWIAPEQWMIEGAGLAETDFADTVTQACPGYRVAEQTDGFFAVEVTSAASAVALEALLARLVNLDMAAFGPGCATRTGLEHMAVFVLRRAQDHVAILGMRSAAHSLWHKLVTTASALPDA